VPINNTTTTTTIHEVTRKAEEAANEARAVYLSRFLDDNTDSVLDPGDRNRDAIAYRAAMRQRPPTPRRSCPPP
jgi:hypothetical protein